MDTGKLRKMHSEADMLEQLRDLPSVERAVETVATETTSLKAAYHARIAAIRTAKTAAAKIASGNKKGRKGVDVD